MKTDLKQQDVNVKWQDLTPGCVVLGPATAPEFLTGEWRVDTPVLIVEKCKNCLICSAVCPDSCIPVKDGKRLAFDYDHCKGCGICVAACPFKALELVQGEANAERAMATVEGGAK